MRPLASAPTTRRSPFGRRLAAITAFLLAGCAADRPTLAVTPSAAATQVLAQPAAQPTTTVTPHRPAASPAATIVETEIEDEIEREVGAERVTATPTATASVSPSPFATATPSATPSATATPRPPSATPTPAAAPIGSLTAVPDGERALVMGQVTAVASFSHGFRFILDDGTGQITLLMWHNVYDDCWAAPQLNLGATVRAAGELGTFNDERQIVPRFGGDVRVPVPGDASTPSRPIGELGQHMGERVSITGAILRLQGGSSGSTLFVADETGEVAVFIWHNVLERIPGGAALGEPGTRVQVTGQVQVFRSNRQVVPTLPYDVVVRP